MVKIKKRASKGRKTLRKAKRTFSRKKVRRALRSTVKKALSSSKQLAKERVETTGVDLDQVREIMGGALFSEFIVKNVGRRATEVLTRLDTPKTDEALAIDLNIKINEIRRMLNVLGTYGIAKYYTNKDEKGWLTFKWYLDVEKVLELNKSIENGKDKSKYTLPDNCNDFFYCNRCYKEQKVIMPFDAAFENQFKCGTCGGKLRQMSRESVVSLF